jgi:hypothetical protein
VFAHAEGAAGHDASDVALAAGAQAALAQRLHAQPCQVLALLFGLDGRLLSRQPMPL